MTVVVVLACVAPGASTTTCKVKQAIKARDLMRASMDGQAAGSGDSPHRRLANCV